MRFLSLCRHSTKRPGVLCLEEVSNRVGLAPHNENENWHTGPAQIKLAFVTATDDPLLMDPARSQVVSKH